jgi:predicted DNA-binding transcriptional regulator YafY
LSAQVNSREERLTIIKGMLFHNPEGARVVTLADACGVDRRTIYRDLARLRSSGVPVYQTQGRFYISRDYYLASVQLTIYEIVTLFLAVRTHTQLTHQQNPHEISVLSRLASSLPEAMRAHIDDVTHVFLKKPIDRLYMSVFETLIRAWSEGREVKVWCRRPPSPVVMLPLFLETNREGVGYLVGWIGDDEQVRSLPLNSVTRVELLREVPLADETQVVARAYLADENGYVPDDATNTTEVRLAFDAEATSLISGNKFATQVSQSEMADGRREVRFRVRDWAELLPWLRTLGTQVEVLSPLSFREYMRAEAERMAAMYVPQHDVISEG